MAVCNQLKRVHSEKVEIYSDFDWDSFYEARKKAAEDINSSSDEEVQEEEKEELDEDKLFADLNYLKNADIGRLMRYLTKQRQRRDAALDSQNVADNR